MDKTPCWLLTGDPGVGKSTVVSKVVWKARESGLSVGGMLTRERRSHGRRVGFEIIDLMSGTTGELSSEERKTGPRVGRYVVNIPDLDRVGVEALASALSKAEIVVCDEVGPMELLSPSLRRIVSKLIQNKTKPKLVVLHKRLRDPLIEEFKASEGSTLIEVTFQNRDSLPTEILRNIQTFMAAQR